MFLNVFIFPKILHGIFALNWQFHSCNICSAFAILLLKLCLQKVPHSSQQISSNDFFPHLKGFIPDEIIISLRTVTAHLLASWLIYALNNATSMSRPVHTFLSPLQGVISSVILSVHSHMSPCQGTNLFIEALTVSPRGMKSSTKQQYQPILQLVARISPPGGLCGLVGNVNEKCWSAVVCVGVSS